MRIETGTRQLNGPVSKNIRTEQELSNAFNWRVVKGLVIGLGLLLVIAGLRTMGIIPFKRPAAPAKAPHQIALADLNDKMIREHGDPANEGMFINTFTDKRADMSLSYTVSGSDKGYVRLEVYCPATDMRWQIDDYGQTGQITFAKRTFRAGHPEEKTVRWDSSDSDNTAKDGDHNLLQREYSDFLQAVFAEYGITVPPPS
jgi:hypothetical protein